MASQGSSASPPYPGESIPLPTITTRVNSAAGNSAAAALPTGSSAPSPVLASMRSNSPSSFETANTSVSVPAPTTSTASQPAPQLVPQPAAPQNGSSVLWGWSPHLSLKKCTLIISILGIFIAAFALALGIYFPIKAAKDAEWSNKKAFIDYCHNLRVSAIRTERSPSSYVQITNSTLPADCLPVLDETLPPPPRARFIIRRSSRTIVTLCRDHLILLPSSPTCWLFLLLHLLLRFVSHKHLLQRR